MAASGDAATAASPEFLQGILATADASVFARGASATADAPELLQGPAFHDSHVVYRTESFLFCARCGSYSALTARRNGGLRSVCKGSPLTQNAKLVRDRFMRGIEPVQPLRHTGRPALPLLLSPVGSRSQ